MEKSDLDYIDSIFSTQRIFFSDEFPLISPTDRYGDEILRTRRRKQFLLNEQVNLTNMNFDGLNWDDKKKLWFKDEFNYDVVENINNWKSKGWSWHKCLNKLEQDFYFTSKSIYSDSKYYLLLDRIYLMNEIIDDNIKNPIIVSFNEKRIQIHPGKTRFWCHEYLNLRPTKTLIHIRNEIFKEEMLDFNVVELKNIEEVLELFIPRKDVKREDLIFRFTPTEGEIIKRIDYEIHDATNTPVLRPLDILDKNTNKSVYQHHDNDEKIKSIIHFNKTLHRKKICVYTNSDNLKEYFLDVEINLQNFKLDEFKLDFDVVFVSEKPNDISELNDYKGFAFWIDKDVLENIKVHLYDFLVFTRYDVKQSSTKDGKIKIVNCECKTSKTWTIHDEFLEI